MSVEHWETFYRGGRLVTCPTGPGPNYSLEAREVWTELFASLPDGACIIDIGTGNGPIPLIAKDVAELAGLKFEIHGIDLAQIAPSRHVEDGERLFAGIHFHPGTSAERMPFATMSADAVTGQYALEYTDLALSLSEVSRVLKPGGRAQFVIHHRDSVVLRNAGPTFLQFQVLFEETRLLRRLRTFLELEREGRDRARGAARELDTAMRQVDAILAATTFEQPVLAMARDAARKALLVRRSVPASQLHSEIGGIERELRDSLRRLQDLERCALDEAGVAALAELAAEKGLATERRSVLLHGGTHVIGWLLALNKGE